MQQSSVTPSLHVVFLGVGEDCCMLSLLLAVPSCIYSFGTVSSLHPTSDFYTCTCTTVHLGLDDGRKSTKPHHIFPPSPGLLPYNFLCVQSGLMLAELRGVAVLDHTSITLLLIGAVLLLVMRYLYSKLKRNATR